MVQKLCAVEAIDLLAEWSQQLTESPWSTLAEWLRDEKLYFDEELECATSEQTMRVFVTKYVE
jgi:hypothetical protein